MLGGYEYGVVSDETTDFIEALTTDEISANYSLPLPRGLWGKPALIRSITLVGVQNLTYEFWFFASATNLTSDPATDQLLGFWQFPELSAGNAGYTVTPAAGGGANPLFRQYADGLEIPYLDIDNAGSPGPSYLHVRLVNRAVAAKNAGATGQFQVQFLLNAQGLSA